VSPQSKYNVVMGDGNRITGQGLWIRGTGLWWVACSKWLVGFVGFIELERSAVNILGQTQKSGSSWFAQMAAEFAEGWSKDDKLPFVAWRKSRCQKAI